VSGTGPDAGDGDEQDHGARARRRVPQDQAARHAQARQARAGALLEDYAELIDDLLAEGGEARPTDIARRLGVSHGTAIKTINRLKREGLAHAKPYRGVFLTEAGRALARPCAGPAPLVVDLLVAVGVPDAVAEADAEAWSTT
jgi:DtxR family manganese transport transcriptional regulator